MLFSFFPFLAESHYQTLARSLEIIISNHTDKSTEVLNRLVELKNS